MVNTTMNLLEWPRKQLEEADTDLLKRNDEVDGADAHGCRGIFHLRGGIPGEERRASELGRRPSPVALGHAGGDRRP